MKSLFGLAALLVTTSSYALEIDCVATEVYDTSYLEESFTVEEYPDVWIKDTEVYIGSARFAVDRDDKITLLPFVGFEKSIQIDQAENGPTYIININTLPTNKIGTISAKNPEEKEASIIADIECK